MLDNVNENSGATNGTLSYSVPSGESVKGIALTTPAANGTAVVNADGTYTYTPKSGFAGTDTFSYTLTTLGQLRLGSAPNPWEVGWSMFRFRDLHDYYWFILKPNGWELGKKQGSDVQIFLATGTAPALRLGQPNRVRIRAVGPRIQVFVDDAPVVDYTDARPLPSGSVGLYEEDSVVRFDSVAVTGA